MNEGMECFLRFKLTAHLTRRMQSAGKNHTPNPTPIAKSASVAVYEFSKRESAKILWFQLLWPECTADAKFGRFV
jgi:hypothetical protein